MDLFLSLIAYISQLRIACDGISPGPFQHFGPYFQIGSPPFLTFLLACWTRAVLQEIVYPWRHAVFFCQFPFFILSLFLFLILSYYSPFFGRWFKFFFFFFFFVHFFFC